MTVFTVATDKNDGYLRFERLVGLKQWPGNLAPLYNEGEIGMLIDNTALIRLK